MKKSLTIKNDIGQLACLNEFLQQFFPDTFTGKADGMNIRLAIEEAVVNAISYAYPDEEGKDIDVCVETGAKRIKVVITDSGVAFDPTAKKEPDISLPLEKRPIGGLGTYLVKQLMTDVSYSRSGGKNILTMIKTLD